MSKVARRLFYRAVLGEKPPADVELERKVLVGIVADARCLRWGVRYLRLGDFSGVAEQRRFKGIREAIADYKPSRGGDKVSDEFRSDCHRLRRLDAERVIRRLSWRIVEIAHEPIAKAVIGQKQVRRKGADAIALLDKLIQRLEK